MVIFTSNRARVASQYLFKSLLLKSMRPFDSQHFKSATQHYFGQRQILRTHRCLELRDFLGSKLVWSELCSSNSKCQPELNFDAPILVRYPPCRSDIVKILNNSEWSQETKRSVIVFVVYTCKGYSCNIVHIFACSVLSNCHYNNQMVLLFFVANWFYDLKTHRHK